MSTVRTSQVMGPAEWRLLLLLSLLWGGSFFFSKVALAELPPFSVVLARVGSEHDVSLRVITPRRHKAPRL